MKEERAHTQNVLIKMKITARLIHALNSSAWIAVIIACCSCISCDRDIKVVSDFPVDRQLKGQHIKKLDSLFTAYSITKIADRFAISIKKEKYFLCVCDDNFNILHKTLKKGNGHNEWLAPMLTGQTTNINNTSHALVLERERNRLYAVNVNNPASEPIILKDFSKDNLHNINYVYTYETDKYIGGRMLEQCELFDYDAKKHETDAIVPHHIDPALFSADRHSLSQTLATYNDRQKAMAVSYFTFPIISLISAKDKKDRTLQIGQEVPSYTKQNVSEPHFYFLDICSTDNNIYVLYDDPEFKEEMSILAFDWEGTAIARYRVPRLTCFTVDESHKRFVGIKEDDTEGVFFEFRF